MIFMEKDQTYKYFKRALNRWLELKKAEGESPQKLLALRSNTTDGTVSKYLKREKPIPFEMQVSFANACGHDYLSFILWGKKIVEAEEPLVPNIQDEADKRHQIVITGFQNKEIATEINEILVEIEKIRPKHLEDILIDMKTELFKVKKNYGEETILKKTGTTNNLES